MCRFASLLTLLVLLLPAGCSTGVGRYFQARALDLADVVPVSVAAGYGLSAQARVTPFAGLGLGWTNNWRAGMGEQRFGPIWWEKERGIPIIRYYRYQDYRGHDTRIPGGDPYWWDETNRKRASTLIIFPSMTREGLLWFPILPPYFLKDHWETPAWSGWNLLNVEAGVFVGVVGIRVAVSPLQLLEFLPGLITIDLGKDDPRVYPVQWPAKDAEPSFPDTEEDSEPSNSESEGGGGSP